MPGMAISMRPVRKLGALADRCGSRSGMKRMIGVCCGLFKARSRLGLRNASAY